MKQPHQRPVIKYNIILCCSLTAMIAVFLSFRAGSTTHYDSMYKTKGFGENGILRLKPVILETGGEIFDIVGTGIDNTMMTINGDGEFCAMTIADNGYVSRKAVVPGFPPHKVIDIHGDCRYNMVWQILSGGISILDLKTKTTRTFGVTSATDEAVKEAFLADPDKKLFHITVDKIGENDTKRYFLLYDFIADKVLYKSPCTEKFFHPFNGKMLFQMFTDRKRPNHFIWGMTDLRAQANTANSLTKKLTSLQIDVSNGLRAIHDAEKILFGSGMKGNGIICYFVRWDSKYHPTVITVPGTGISDEFMISPDGKWVRTFDEDASGSRSELLIFSIQKDHPGGLSLPIKCGYSRENDKGAFMYHREWGPCYVDYGMEHPNHIFVYQLKDGLELAVKKK